MEVLRQQQVAFKIKGKWVKDALKSEVISFDTWDMETRMESAFHANRKIQTIKVNGLNLIHRVERIASSSPCFKLNDKKIITTYNLLTNT